MDPSNLFQTLRSSKFFRGFTDEQLQGLPEICKLQEIPPRSTVFEEFDKARKVYIILSGEISLAICDAEEACRQIAVVHEGDLMGWSPLVGRARLYDSARSLTAVVVLVFDGDTLMKYCSDNPAFGFRFMHRVACTLAERLSGTRLQLLEMSGVHLPEFQVESD
jgi:CRP/FNR family transcriptional regulator, cyclic AMP receptor protein